MNLLRELGLLSLEIPCVTFQGWGVLRCLPAWTSKPAATPRVARPALYFQITYLLMTWRCENITPLCYSTFLSELSLQNKQTISKCFHVDMLSQPIAFRITSPTTALIHPSHCGVDVNSLRERDKGIDCRFSEIHFQKQFRNPVPSYCFWHISKTRWKTKVKFRWPCHTNRTGVNISSRFPWM